MISGTLPLAGTAHDRMGSAWDFISATRLNLWLRCPLAFRLRYIDGIKTPTTPTLFLGKRVHDALEVLYRHRQLGIDLAFDDLAQRIAESWAAAAEEENMRFDKPADEEQLKQKTVDLVKAYCNQVDDRAERPVAVETWLEADLVDPATGEDLGIPLVGVVDLIFSDDDGEIVCDFKTAAKSGPPFAITHEIQLTSYSYLFRQQAGHDEAGLEIRSLIKTKTPKIEFKRFPPPDEAQFRRYFAVVRAYLDDLKSERFVYRPGFGCSFCDYRDHHCKSWCGQTGLAREQ